VDGELSAYRSRRIAEHLAGCPSCRRQLESLQEVIRILQELPAMPVPDGLAARVQAAAMQKIPKTESVSPVGRLAEWFTQELQEMPALVRLAACGAALAAVLVGVLVGEQIFPANRNQTVSAAGQDLSGLEWFSAAPPISVAAACLATPPASSPAEGGAR